MDFAAALRDVLIQGTPRTLALRVAICAVCITFAAPVRADSLAANPSVPFSPAAQTLMDSVRTDAAAPFALAVFGEVGSAYTMLCRGLRNDIYPNAFVMETFGTASGDWGTQLAAGLDVALLPWLHAAAALQMVQLRGVYGDEDERSPAVDSSGAVQLVGHAFDTHVTFTELSIEPRLRILPWPSSFPIFFEGGAAFGTVVHQGASYTTRTGAVSTNGNATNIGRAQVGWDAMAGIGGTISIMERLELVLAVRARFGLTPLFADNYPSATTVVSVIGMQYTVR